MRRPLIAIVIAIIVIAAGASYYVATSNLLLKTATVRFSPGTNGMNNMQILAPANTLCIDYYLTQTSIDPEAPMGIGGWGVRDCPLFGTTGGSSTNYPATGVIENIPIDQPVVVYKTDLPFELHILIASDYSVFQRILDEYDRN